MTEPQASKIYLPLRASVELFSDPQQPPALVRAKQAAVLHDHLLVETGFLDVSITDEGGTHFWIPPDQITEEQIARARNPAAPGTPMTLAIGEETRRGEPAPEMRAILSGEISSAYGAEWHSEVIEPLIELGVEWMEPVETGGGEIDRGHPLGAAIARQNFTDSGDKELMPSVNTFRRDFIYKSFNRDAGVAHGLGAAFQITTLFEPMLERGSYSLRPSGSTALEVVAPNLGALPWEEIAEFRDHPGAVEARALMLGFEQRAMEQEPEDARDYLLKVSQQVTNGLLGALKDRQTNVPKAAAEEAAKTGIALIPGVGPFIEKGLTALQLAGEKVHEQRSGIAALMKLRK